MTGCGRCIATRKGISVSYNLCIANPRAEKLVRPIGFATVAAMRQTIDGVRNQAVLFIAFSYIAEQYLSKVPYDPGDCV